MLNRLRFILGPLRGQNTGESRIAPGFGLRTIGQNAVRSGQTGGNGGLTSLTGQFRGLTGDAAPDPWMKLVIGESVTLTVEMTGLTPTIPRLLWTSGGCDERRWLWIDSKSGVARKLPPYSIPARVCLSCTSITSLTDHALVALTRAGTRDVRACTES